MNQEHTPPGPIGGMSTVGLEGRRVCSSGLAIIARTHWLVFIHLSSSQQLLYTPVSNVDTCCTPRERTYFPRTYPPQPLPWADFFVALFRLLILSHEIIGASLLQASPFLVYLMYMCTATISEVFTAAVVECLKYPTSHQSARRLRWIFFSQGITPVGRTITGSHLVLACLLQSSQACASV